MINIRQLPNCIEGEKTVLFLRRHWVSNISILFYSIILFGLPILLRISMTYLDFNLMDNPDIAPFILVATAIYSLFVMIIVLSQFTDYYLDTWIVTTERVINIEQNGLFNRTVSELHLNEIQDVTSETEGFLATFLTFGNVYVQTAAEKERFNFKQIDNPDQVKETIVRLVQDDKLRHPLMAGDGLRAPENLKLH